MRPARLVSGLALLVLGTASARAETPRSYEATIAVPSVEVRSGPSTSYYPTSKLRQGDTVTVVREESGGWLAIKPPRGSFSWINSMFLDEGNTITRIVHGETKVRIGSSLTNDPPAVEQVRLGRGAQVFLLDHHKAYDKDTPWLPILPPEQEVRFIPHDAIKLAPQVQVVQSPPADSHRTLSPIPAPNAPTNETRWQQAEAVAATNPDEAKRLFRQLADDNPNDQDLRLRCYNRIHFLMTGNRGSVPYGYQPGYPSQATYPNTGGYAPAAPTLRSPQPYSPVRAMPTSSQYTYYRETSAPRFAPTATYNYAQRPVSPTAQWSQPGWLRRTGFWLGNQRPYALVSNDGKVILYMTPLPGVSLDGFVERYVQLWGPISYHNEMRTYYMTVQHVQALTP